ncbi:uncharacterized protein si:ch211-102c2.4 [Thunnus albacares]|uniref:uncharacterized protein si:ch211-102c2.4 n=1 Tax=Thunnus albacares TaxID=8236 RepID=UPI001CF6C70D|nr:uncharacterized protein si:ch211-102c2.4 [Thunnus albacares]
MGFACVICHFHFGEAMFLSVRQFNDFSKLLQKGACEAVYWQRLTCPYELRFESMPRVWCRQSSTECCTGLVFGQDTQSVDGVKLEVVEGSDSFTVAVRELSRGEGVYWCGVLSGNDTIIKLAEGYFHSYSGLHLIRWILLPLLPMVTVFTYIYSRATTKHMRKKTEEPHDDVTLRRRLAEPQYENTAALNELE